MLTAIDIANQVYSIVLNARNMRAGEDGTPVDKYFEPVPVQYGPLVVMPAFFDGDYYWGAIHFVAVDAGPTGKDRPGVIALRGAGPNARASKFFPASKLEDAVNWAGEF